MNNENAVYVIETVGMQPYLSYEALAQRWNLGQKTIVEKVRQMEEWNAKERRYPKEVVLRDGNIVRVNEFAFADWIKFKRDLMSARRKYVKPFSSSFWAEVMGYRQRPIREAVDGKEIEKMLSGNKHNRSSLCNVCSN